jgi:hypothetical protein
MHVLITTRQAIGGETAVGVVRLRDQAPLWACVGRGEAGAALATIAAVQWCALHGHTIVTPDGDVLDPVRLGAERAA